MKGLFLFPPVTPWCAALGDTDPCSTALFKTTLDISVETGVSEEENWFSLGPFSERSEKPGLIILALSIARMMVPAFTIAACSCVPLHGAKLSPSPQREMWGLTSTHCKTGIWLMLSFDRPRKEQGASHPWLLRRLCGEAEGAALLTPHKELPKLSKVWEECKRHPDINIKGVIPKVCRNKRQMVIGHSGIRIIMTERELGMKERAGKCQQLGSRDHELSQMEERAQNIQQKQVRL